MDVVFGDSDPDRFGAALGCVESKTLSDLSTSRLASRMRLSSGMKLRGL